MPNRFNLHLICLGIFFNQPKIIFKFLKSNLPILEYGNDMYGTFKKIERKYTFIQRYT